IFPYSSQSTTSSWQYHPSFTPTDNDHDIAHNNISQNVEDQSSPPSNTNISQNIENQFSSASDTNTDNPNITENTPIVSPPSPRPIRDRRAPSYLSDYVCNLPKPPVNQTSKGTLYPISEHHSLSNLSTAHHAYTLSVTHTQEPRSYSETCKHECWQRAMDAELEALTKTGTWVIIDLPPLAKPIGCKWVYKVKYKADGTIERHKASQNFTSPCFNPTVAFASIRCK
ncbi:retrovirus-related pol polyprotein from transposon TNT 1-94, partial [Trifolium medium]|nr:retrovirus-related pol polyprotein from transposon TNT 1-94 [Trifolium medium]